MCWKPLAIAGALARELMCETYREGLANCLSRKSPLPIAFVFA